MEMTPILVVGALMQLRSSPNLSVGADALKPCHSVVLTLDVAGQSPFTEDEKQSLRTSLEVKLREAQVKLHDPKTDPADLRTCLLEVVVCTSRSPLGDYGGFIMSTATALVQHPYKDATVAPHLLDAVLWKSISATIGGEIGIKDQVKTALDSDVTAFINEWLKGHQSSSFKGANGLGLERRLKEKTSRLNHPDSKPQSDTIA